MSDFRRQVIAIILARGGSKCVKRKNLRTVGGKPLIAWTIAAARASKYITTVIVSTEDVEIAKVAKEYGATVPFMRPIWLAQDDTDQLDAIDDAIRCIMNTGTSLEDDTLIMSLNPTNPLRSNKDI